MYLVLQTTEFLCAKQKGDNLDQQKNWEDQLNQISASPVTSHC